MENKLEINETQIKNKKMMATIKLCKIKKKIILNEKKLHF